MNFTDLLARVVPDDSEEDVVLVLLLDGLEVGRGLDGLDGRSAGLAGKVDERLLRALAVVLDRRALLEEPDRSYANFIPPAEWNL